jgi:hypothetical protein
MNKDAKTDIPGIYRSPEGFLINKDKDALAAYKARKNRDHELDKIKQDVISIKDDLTEIKEILKKVIK